MKAIQKRSSIILILILVLLLGTGVLSIYKFHLFTFAGYKDTSKLTFSNTQTWNPEYYNTLPDPTLFSTSQLSSIILPPPPSNTSQQTKEELLEMHAKELLRTPEKMKEINDENTSAQVSIFGTTTLESFVNEKDRPFTSALVDFIFAKSGPVIFMEKKKFDRVRPSYLDPTLTTALPVPQHASYPSGHSTQFHMLATILSRLDPKDTNIYFDSAERIGIDREIAGLHYPSDTEAGRLLAAQLVEILFTDKSFVELFNEAQTEWQ